MRRDLDELIALINERGLGDDPVIRQRIAELKIGVEALRLGALRALTQQMKVGHPRPRGLARRSGSGRCSTRGSPSSPPTSSGRRRSSRTPSGRTGFLRSRANSIEGGTTEVMKNIIAERVLGLPRLR